MIAAGYVKTNISTNFELQSVFYCAESGEKSGRRNGRGISRGNITDGKKKQRIEFGSGDYRQRRTSLFYRKIRLISFQESAEAFVAKIKDRRSENAFLQKCKDSGRRR